LRPVCAPASAAPASSWPAYFRASSFFPGLLQIAYGAHFTAEQFAKTLYFRMRQSTSGNLILRRGGPRDFSRRGLHLAENHFKAEARLAQTLQRRHDLLAPEIELKRFRSSHDQSIIDQGHFG